MANGFYTVYALRAWEAPEWQVGVFTTIFLAGQLVGNLGLGWLADHAGHRLVLVLGLAAMVAGNLVALGAGSVETFGPVFALSGIHNAAVHVSARTILLELAVDVVERPTYIGLANTALAPLSFGAPLVAGLMADRLGFATVFGVAAALCAVSLVLLLGRVREPRHTPRETRERSA
ncbi:MAG: MFS transporter [Candidatus Rokubacteria bacterium]|nr:MFS transporter [Candidatus Rokubacteria bacterium]